MAKEKTPNRKSLDCFSRTRVWLNAAGICEYEHCYQNLWIDEMTRKEFNQGYIAHIYAVAAGGPRYHPELSPKHAEDPAYLMLMCDKHHRLIDREAVSEHPAERLLEMKENHQKLVDHLRNLPQRPTSEVVRVRARINQGRIPSLSFTDVKDAVLLNNRYPAPGQGVNIDLTSVPYGNGLAFYEATRLALHHKIEIFIRQGAGTSGNPLSHLSIAAIAPIPLLIDFGLVLGDSFDADIFPVVRHAPRVGYQRHEDQSFDYEVEEIEGSQDSCEVIILVQVSGPIHLVDVLRDSSLANTLPAFSFSTTNPKLDTITSAEQISLFRRRWRDLMVLLRHRYGASCVIHLFAAVPSCLAIEMGRALLPAVDPEIRIYESEESCWKYRFAILVNKPTADE